MHTYTMSFTTIQLDTRIIRCSPDKIREEDRSLLRLRINLVQDRTRVMNRVHSLLDKYDVNCISCSHLFGKKGIKWLKALQLEGNDQVQINNYINNIEFLNNELTKSTKRFHRKQLKIKM
jgi:hypothetical protein